MKKISLLIVAMMLLVSCGAKTTVEDKATGTSVDVSESWVEVNTDGTSVDVGADGVNVDFSGSEEETPTTPTTEDTTSTSETSTTSETNKAEDKSTEGSTSVKISGDSVDVNAWGLDVKIN